jgi:hypothetical protein
VKGQSRTAIISHWRYGGARTAADVPPPPPTTTVPTPDDANDDAADSAVSEAIAEMQAAFKKAQAAQEQDSGSGGTDVNDDAVTADLEALGVALAQLASDQAKDTSGDAGSGDDDDAGDDDQSGSADAPGKGGTPVGDTSSNARLAITPADPQNKGAPVEPIDDDGNVHPDLQCGDPDCGHMGAVHEDTPTGQNSGPCTSPDCMCLAMKVDTSTVQDDGTGDSGGGPDNAGGDDAAPATTEAKSARSVALADAPGGTAPAPDAAPAAASTDDEPDLNEPPEMAGGENMGPAFTIPVGVICGQPTGDGRSIAVDALSWRIPPMPLMGLATETHDPNGWDLNDPAVICGRIDSLSLGSGEGGTQIVEAHGFYLPDDNGRYFSDLNEAMGRMGISADIAVEESAITMDEVDADGWPISISETLTKGTIMGFTVVPYPAFEGAYIVLGDGTEGGPVAIPQEQPENADGAVAAAARIIAARLARPRLLTYEDCGCGSSDALLVASGGPDRPPGAWFADPNFGADGELADSRLRRMTNGNYACPITVDDNGRLFGHIAAWGVCHTGVQGECILAPHSKNGYANFLRGQHIVTAEGETVRVGTLSAGTGHAATSGRGARPVAAMAHYDDTGWGAADVSIGEDAYGIWIAGAVRPGATEAQVQTIRASAPSGDWRDFGSGLEMVAILEVNNPGFPLAITAGGKITSLVAAGAMPMALLAAQAKAEDEALVARGAHIDATLRRAMAPVLEAQGIALRARFAEEWAKMGAQARERLRVPTG